MAIPRFHKTFLLLFLSCLLLAGNAHTKEKDPANIRIRLFIPQQDIVDIRDFSRIDKPVDWQPVRERALYLKQNNGFDWVRIDIANASPLDEERLIEIATTEIQSADVYNLFFTGNNARVTPLFENKNLLHRFSDRPVNYRNLVYPATIPGNSTKSLLFKIYHDFEVKPHFNIQEPDLFQEYINQEYVFFGMIYGSLFMIVIYNFFIYLSLREKSHLLFVLFGTFTSLFISMQEGHFSQFIAPDSLWPKEIIYAITTALMCLFFTFFTIRFLDIERWSIWLPRLMLAMGAIAIFFLLLLGSTSEPMIFSHYTLLILIFLYSTAIGIGIYINHQGMPAAGFFSLAIFLCTLGLLTEFISRLPMMPLLKLSYNYASIGNAAMALVFAFALADKMRILQNEKITTSMKLVKMSEDKAENALEIYKAKLHEIQLEKETSEIKIENRAKSDFFATMSHEIRTPMNGVMGMTELLQDTELDQKQKRYVASISSSAKALLNAINDLLDYSNIESGKMELESKLFNLEKVIDDCINIFSLRASEIKINFFGQIQPGTPLQFKGDANKLRQIILNLLGNSFNFNNKSDIFINVYPTGKSTVNSLELRFEIINKGVVLDDKDRESLFSPFQDLTSSELKHHGHELGLTVSRQLAEMMQGKIGVETDKGKNTTTLWFTSRLLLPHSNEEKDLPDRTKILGGRRLLICDPNQEFITAVETMTRSWGMETSSVTDNKDVPKKLLNNNKAYQVLMIAEECLTPEVQLAVRQSNLEHSFITSIILTTRTRFSITPEEIRKRGIQFVLEKPHTTEMLYLSLLKSMGVESGKQEPGEDDKRLSVLVAEDNNVNLMVIEGLLKKMKFLPLTAHDGKQAVDIYLSEKTPIDLVFMDCEMPEMDGYEATKAIRDYESSHGLRSVIIGLSAHSTHEYKERALAAGMDSFLVKPVTGEDMENIIERFYSASPTPGKDNK